MSEIYMERGLLKRAGALAAGLLPVGKAAILADDTVNALWGDALEKSLAEAGWRAYRYAFASGEANKTLDTYGRMLEFLARCGLTRSDTVFALGGGVTGDLAGFAAATYLRGVNLVQVPTTLLACVDSSVGGKTAVDLPAGKNLAGAFYPPHAVLIDPDLLATLPDRTYFEGEAEVVKYAAIQDAGILPLLSEPRANEMEIIRRCVSIKREIVATDERDTGARQILNFGHTFGHAAEKWSGYEYSHGAAVSIGMAIMARACAEAGLCERSEAQRLLDALRLLSLPVSTAAPAQELAKILRADKKRSGDGITLVLFRAVGRCELRKVSLAEAREMLERGWKA